MNLADIITHRYSGGILGLNDMHGRVVIEECINLGTIKRGDPVIPNFPNLTIEGNGGIVGGAA